MTLLCGPDPGYGCTTGGYAGKSEDWPGKRYGAGYASQNAYGYHNCVLYAAYRLQANGLSDPGWVGNASTWDTQAYAGGTAVDQSPAVGAIAQWNGGPVGHVAYVETVTSSYLEVTDDSVDLNRTNRWRIAAGSPAWPDNFVHLKDLPAPGSGPHDVNGDGRADLVIVGTGPTGSGRTEVHALNGATAYSTWVGHWATAAGYSNSTSDRHVMGDVNGDGRADLVIVGTGPTGSGRTEVHALNGATSYSTRLGHWATAAAYSNSSSDRHVM
ncbi:CHAP domain-containing protein [Actinoplanes sp. NPDC051494]|uniref:CHAP domain-containing protein n=1 Tax=Actinoplanes sp. NPDC051494 TaxID=3363907 RepID=UPI0037A653FB